MDDQISHLKSPKVKSPRIHRKVKMEPPSPVYLKSLARKRSEENNNITGLSNLMTSIKSAKRKRSMEDFQLPMMNDVVIKMEDSSPEVSPKKAHKQKSSRSKTCSTEHLQNNSHDFLENSFKKSNGKSPKSSPSSLFSPAKDMRSESPNLVSPKTVSSKRDIVYSPGLDKSSRKSSDKFRNKRELVVCQVKNSPSKFPDKKPKLSELPVFDEADHSMTEMKSPKTPKKMKLTKLTSLTKSSSSESDVSLKSPMTDSQNRSELDPHENILSYKCPDGFVPFSFKSSALDYVSSEECNVDNCKLFLIKAPADFPVQKLPSKIILNGVQSFHCNEIPYEVHSLVDNETSSLTSLVHNSQTNQLEQGPPFVGQIHVIQYVNVPHEESNASTPEQQRVPFPEGLQIRYKPFGSANPVCFSTEHQHVSASTKKKRKKSKHSIDEVTDSACDSSKEKKKKKKKKKNKNKSI